MQPEKRKTLESFFRSFKKKNRGDGAVELNAIESSVSDLPSGSSLPDKPIEPASSLSSSSSITIVVSSIATSQAKSVPNDISN